MPAILLIRHAQASYGSDDYDVLSERGEQQAVAVHRELDERGIRPNRIVSGSLRRQRDSAAPWLGHGAALEIDPRWDEYDAADVLEAHSSVPASLEAGAGDPPQLESRDFQGVLDQALLAWIAAGEASPAREPWPAFRGRVEAALRDLAAALGSGETAFVFTSGGVIGACCSLALGLPDASLVAFNHVTINGAISKIVSGRRGASLVSFNEHAHLEPGGLITYR